MLDWTYVVFKLSFDTYKLVTLIKLLTLSFSLLVKFGLIIPRGLLQDDECLALQNNSILLGFIVVIFLVTSQSSF